MLGNFGLCWDMVTTYPSQNAEQALFVVFFLATGDMIVKERQLEYDRPEFLLSSSCKLSDRQGDIHCPEMKPCGSEEANPWKTRMARPKQPILAVVTSQTDSTSEPRVKKINLNHAWTHPPTVQDDGSSGIRPISHVRDHPARHSRQ